MELDVDIDAQKQLGRQRAISTGATKHKTTGQTSPTNYPFTHWWVVGYNEAVDEMATQ
jgi:hypothetical protein